jgi:hypothetical protein
MKEFKSSEQLGMFKDGGADSDSTPTMLPFSMTLQDLVSSKQINNGERLLLQKTNI